MRNLNKSVSVALIFILTSFGKAAAADIPLKARPLPLPVSNWTGFYVGGTVGAGQDSSATNELWLWNTNYPTGTLVGTNGGPLLATTSPLSINTGYNDQYRHSSLGVVGGVEAGYNLQRGRWVYGIEGDFSLSSQSSGANYAAQPVPAFFPPLPIFFFMPGTTQGWSSTERIDWLTTVRGRLGVTTDSSLWYGTAGVAAARIGTSYTLTSSPGFSGLPVASGGFGPGTFGQWGMPNGLAQTHFGTTKVGWVVGGGVETSLNRLLGIGASNWTTKVEYLYADLGSVNNSIVTGLVPVCASTCANPATGTTTFNSSIHVHEQILRVGLNYNFGGGPSAPPAPAPIYAKAPRLLPVSNWTGFYVGGTVGAGQDSSKTSELWLWNTNYPTGTLVGINGGPLFTTTSPLSFSTGFNDQYHHSSLGVVGGVEAGYNLQRGRWVYGVEGDFSLSSQGSAASYAAQPVPAVFPPLPNFFFVPDTTQGWRSAERIEWLTTVRGRLGVTTDSSLWYGTAGVAAARIGTSYTLTSSPGYSGLPVASGPFGPGTFGQWGLANGLTQAHFGTTKIGWVVGGGVETSLNRLLGIGSSNWTTKVEYLYADLGSVNNSIVTGLVPVCATTCANPATGSTAFNSSIHVHEQILRVGLNYRFSNL
jgi:outer membrane immunogenic protein